MRRILVVLATMGATVLVASGVAYALSVTCDGTGDQDPTIGVCQGTPDSDTITGTSNGELILAKGGSDRVRALGGNDEIIGDEGDSGDARDRISGDGGNDTVDGFGGNDVIYGGPDGDGNTGDPSSPFSGLNLEGAENSDVVYGEEGDDIIDAAGNDTPGSRDRSIGGAGNDQINAADDNVDVINCGDGGGDVVVMDELDTQRNCETLAAP